MDRDRLEPVQLVRYGAGQGTAAQTDWVARPGHSNAVATGGNRASSFAGFVSVGDNATTTSTTGGGLNFPLMDAPRDGRWCNVVDCDAPYEAGLVLRPVAGNAVFWENLRPDGSGEAKTLRAALPVAGGEVVAVNIWLRQTALSEEARGEEYYPEFD